MSNIEYSIENTPDASDDKVIRNGIVDFNSKIIKKNHPISAYLQKTVLRS